MTASSTSRDGYVAVPGGRVWYRVAGGGDGVPLLVLHGGPGVPHDYLEPLGALGDERPVVFYDQLGCGNSDRPDDPALWHVGRFVEELARVRDALRLGRVHLLGQSWGTMLAVEYALGRPDGLVGLVLADPSLSMPRWIADTAALRAALPQDVRATLDRHEAAGTTDSEEYQAATMAFYRRHVCRLDPWPEPFLRSFTRVNQALYRQMAGESEFVITGSLAGYDRTDRLGELDVPALFLCGRYDEATPEATAWYSGLVRGAECVVFEHSSHVPHLEEPERYLRVVREFLRRAERR